MYRSIVVMTEPVVNRVCIIAKDHTLGKPERKIVAPESVASVIAQNLNRRGWSFRPFYAGLGWVATRDSR